MILSVSKSSSLFKIIGHISRSLTVANYLFNEWKGYYQKKLRGIMYWSQYSSISVIATFFQPTMSTHQQLQLDLNIFRMKREKTWKGFFVTSEADFLEPYKIEFCPNIWNDFTTTQKFQVKLISLIVPRQKLPIVFKS